MPAQKWISALGVLACFPTAVGTAHAANTEHQLPLPLVTASGSTTSSTAKNLTLGRGAKTRVALSESSRIDLAWRLAGCRGASATLTLSASGRTLATLSTSSTKLRNTSITFDAKDRA